MDHMWPQWTPNNGQKAPKKVPRAAKGLEKVPILTDKTNQKAKDRYNMRVANIIKEKLTEALSPTNLEILDESHKHAGHAGARPEGESHFSVKIVSNAFEGKSRVERQRLVYQALSEELKQDIHALALHTMAPNESEKL